MNTHKSSNNDETNPFKQELIDELKVIQLNTDKTKNYKKVSSFS